MKKLLLFSLIALLLGACSSSDDDNNPVNNTITVTPTNVEDISQDGGTFTIELKTAGEWAMSVQNAEWCTLSAKAGKGNANIEVTIAKNESTTARNTKIIVSNGTTIEVSQKAKVVYTTGEEAIIGGVWVIDSTYTPEYEIKSSSEDAEKDIREKLTKLEPYSDQYVFYADGKCDADGVSKDGYYDVFREIELDIRLPNKSINRLTTFTKSADNDKVLYIHERLISQVNDKWPQTTKANKTYRYTRK